MVPDEHDGDLLPGRQQLEPEARGRLYEPVGGIGVEPVALLEDALVDGGGREVDAAHRGGRGGHGAAAVAADTAGHGVYRGGDGRWLQRQKVCHQVNLNFYQQNHQSTSELNHVGKNELKSFLKGTTRAPTRALKI